MQLHYRYKLGFISPAIDGKRHELRVELRKAAAAEHKRARLRYRPEYIPVPGGARVGTLIFFSGTTVVQFRMKGVGGFASVGSSYWLRLTTATLFTPLHAK